MEEDNLKQNILAVVSGLLCDEMELRNVAEDRRKALEFKPEYPVQLADILHDTNEAFEERQMCAFMLKEYINQYWEFKTSFCTAEVKATTRTLLSHSLGDQNVKIMDSAAYLLGMIAQVDYPHTWKEMLSMLNEKLRSQDQRIVIGGVTFMQECFQKIPRLLHENLINESMYDFFYGITEQEQIYSTPLRSKVIELVTNLIIQDFSRDKDIARVGPIASRFTAIMGYIMNQQYGPSSDFQIKAAVVASYTKFLCCIPEVVGQLVITTLPIIWDILIACTDEYRQIIAVRSNSNAFLQHRVLPRDSTEEPGCYPTNFMTLVENIFNMINYVVVTEEPFASVDVDLYMGEKNLTDILHSILIFLCATPYTERDILNSELDCIDEDLLDEDTPTSYVSLSSVRFSRIGLKQLLHTVIRSSSSVVKPLACVRMAIIRALEYMQLRRASPIPPDLMKLRYLEEECNVAATLAATAAVIANRAAQAAGAPVVPPQSPFVAVPIFSPLPGGYDIYSTRVAESILHILCSIAPLMGSPQELFTTMVQSTLPFPPPEIEPVQPIPRNRAGPSGRIGLGFNYENLMFGFDDCVQPDKLPSLTDMELTIREFVNRFQNIAQADDLLLNSRLTLAAAHYGWVFSVDEYKFHLGKIAEHLLSEYELYRHAAVRALRIHCSYFKGETQPPGFVNAEVRMQLRNQFIRFIPDFNNSLVRIWPFANIDMLNVIVANITYLVTMNNHASRHMVEFIMDSLAKHMVHSAFVKNIKMLIEALTISVRNKNYFQLHLLQRVLDILRNANSPADVDNQSVTNISIGLDLFSELLRLADAPNIQLELISPSVRIVYMALMATRLDVEVARNGQRCLSMYFLRFGEQMLLLRNIMNCEAYMCLFNHMMDLSHSEELCIGLEHPFLSMLIILHEDFQHGLDKFVKSLLSRLNHAQSMDVRDSLIMMFLGLFYYHSEATMHLLDMLPGPDGTTSALIFIVPLLLDVHYNSCYTQNLYVHVITNIMQQSFQLDDRRFLDLQVEHNYFTQKGVVHNRYVLQPRFASSSSMDQTIANGHETASTVTSTVDSDIAIPPSYRGDTLTPRDSLARLPSLLQSRISLGGASVSDRPAIPLISGPSNRDSPSSTDSNVRDIPSTSSDIAGPSTSAAADVESMDLSYSSSLANFPVPSIVPPLDLQSLMTALSAAAATFEDHNLLEEISVNTVVPFLRKAFRMLLDVMLVNRRDSERGEVILGEAVVFPEAEPNMDIRRYRPLTALATMDVVPFIQSFFDNLVDGNYLELFQLCQDLNPHHTREVDRMLQVHDAEFVPE